MNGILGKKTKTEELKDENATELEELNELVFDEDGSGDEGDSSPSPFGPTREERKAFDELIKRQSRKGAFVYRLDENGDIIDVNDRGLKVYDGERDALKDITACSNYLIHAPPEERDNLKIEVTTDWSRTKGKLAAVEYKVNDGEENILIIHLFGLFKLAEFKAANRTKEYNTLRIFLAHTNIDAHEQVHLKGIDDENIADAETIKYLSRDIHREALIAARDVLENSDYGAVAKLSLQRHSESEGRRISSGMRSFAPLRMTKTGILQQSHYLSTLQNRPNFTIIKIAFIPSTHVTFLPSS